ASPLAQGCSPCPGSGPVRRPRRAAVTGGPCPGQPSSTRTSPSLTKSPSPTLTAVTVPPTSAAMGLAIFIDSRITTSWPGTTASPGFTSTFQTVPAMLARIIASRPPPPTSAPQLPGDDQPLDLAGALADLGELRIPPVAGDRQVLHVAGPAV